MHCAGSLALALSLPRTARVEREAAAWGTCAHQVAERCLRTGVDAQLFLGEEETSGRFTFIVDEEMTNTVQVYVDYCRALAARAAATWVEENFSLAALGTPFDSGGTGDFIAYMPAEKLLEIVDLKGGAGVVVDVHENAQARSYALGAMLAHAGLDVDRVRTTIVQPRAPHKDGIIRSETFTVGELLEWTNDLLAGMGRADEALNALAAAQGNQVLLDEWRDAYLRPGKCQFCPAEGVCPALKNDALSMAAKWFDSDPDTGEFSPRNAPLDTSPEALAHDLDMMDMIQNWMNARRAYAQQLAESGETIPGYILVDKRGTRRWLETDEKRAALAIAKVTGLDAVDLFNTKLKSPAQVEKLIPTTVKKKIEPLWEMHVSGTNLVRESKTTRPAVGGIAKRWFEQPEM